VLAILLISVEIKMAAMGDLKIEQKEPVS